MKPYISVVIPVFNSCDILENLYNRLTSVFLNKDYHYEIILVDDGSKDASFEKMSALHDRDSRIKAIGLNENFGQQNAVMCGLHHAQGQYVVTMDDDLQNPPEEIEKLHNKINEGYDVVYGVSSNKKHSFIRNIGSRMTDLLFNMICRKPKHIKVSSFRIMTRDIVEKIIKDTTSFVYISAIVFKNNAKVGNASVIHDARDKGKSNYSLYKLCKLFVNLYLYYSLLSPLRGKSSSLQFVIKDMKL